MSKAVVGILVSALGGWLLWPRSAHAATAASAGQGANGSTGSTGTSGTTPARPPVRPMGPPAPPEPPADWDQADDAPELQVEPPEVLVPAPSGGAPPAPPPPSANTDPRYQLALAAAALLWDLTPNTESEDDKALIRAFQAQEGVSPTGNYNATTGKAFLKYNIVPPKPFYWPSRASQAAAVKADWRNQLLWQAARIDPEHAAEYQAVAQV